MSARKTAVSVAIAVALTACVSTSKYQSYPSEKLVGPTARVRVTRGFGPGTALRAPVYVNEYLIGRIGPGGELSTAVPVGPLRVRSSANTVTITALAGIEYVYEVSLPLQFQLSEPEFEVELATRGAVARPEAALLPSPPPAQQSAKVVAKEVGQWNYAVERVAREAKCAAEPLPQLTGKGPGFETYVVPCFSGDVLAVRCEFGQCRALR